MISFRARALLSIAGLYLLVAWLVVELWERV